MNDKKLKVFNFALLLLGALLTLGFLSYAGGGLSSLLDWFVLLGILPYFILAVVSHYAILHRIAVVVASLSIIFLFSTYVYYDSLFIHPDAQGALIFLFLPIYQLLALLVGFGISGTVGFIQKGR